MARKTEATIDASLPTSLQEAVDRLEDPKATLVAIIDRAVTDARAASWCETFESIMEKAAPELAVSTAYDRRTGRAGKTFVDSAGVSCSGWDREGYSYRTGLHFSTMLDREGYDSNGFHSETGLDRDGFDSQGNNPANPAAAYRFAFTGDRVDTYYLTDWDGFNPDGYRAFNSASNYLTRRDLNVLRKTPERFVFNRNGERNPEAPVAK